MFFYTHCRGGGCEINISHSTYIPVEYGTKMFIHANNKLQIHNQTFCGIVEILKISVLFDIIVV